MILKYIIIDLINLRQFFNTLIYHYNHSTLSFYLIRSHMQNGHLWKKRTYLTSFYLNFVLKHLYTINAVKDTLGQVWYQSCILFCVSCNLNPSYPNHCKLFGTSLSDEILLLLYILAHIFFYHSNFYNDKKYSRL